VIGQIQDRIARNLSIFAASFRILPLGPSSTAALATRVYFAAHNAVCLLIAPFEKATAFDLGQSASPLAAKN
jgi:hypothetical protein